MLNSLRWQCWISISDTTNISFPKNYEPSENRKICASFFSFAALYENKPLSQERIGGISIFIYLYLNVTNQLTLSSIRVAIIFVDKIPDQTRVANFRVHPRSRLIFHIIRNDCPIPPPIRRPGCGEDSFLAS